MDNGNPFSLLLNKRLMLRKIFLNIIGMQGFASRTTLSGIADTRPSTVTDITKELIDEGIICEAGDLPGVADGVARRDLTLDPSYCRAIGIDIQADCIRSVITDFCGGTIDSLTVPVPRLAEKQHIMSALYACIDQTFALLGSERVLGIGVSTIGVLDRSAGAVVATYANPIWSNIPLRDIVSAHCPGLPVFVDDQVVCKLLAAKLRHKDGIDKNTVLVDSGDTLGCSMYFNGEILCNKHGITGEIGHFFVGESNEICTCGNSGCLFTYASSNMIVRKAQRALKNGTVSIINELTEGDLSRLTISIILDAAQKGDRVAVNILTEAALHLGQAVAYVITLLGPDEIILSGNIVSGSELFASVVEEEAKKRSLCLASDRVVFYRESQQELWGAVGAANLPLRAFLAIPGGAPLWDAVRK